MMNWNFNDTKYIIKRILLYLIITGIVFCFGTRCVKATVITDYILSSNQQAREVSGEQDSIQVRANNGTIRDIFVGAGEGYVVFTLAINNGQTVASPVYEVDIGTGVGVSVCELGDNHMYIDNTTQYNLYTAKCHVNFTAGLGLRYIYIRRGGAGSIWWIPSHLATFVGTGTSYSEITQSTNATTNAINNQSTALQQVMWDTTAQEIQAIAQEIGAINNNTQAINNINTTLNNNYTYNSDLDNMFSITTLFQEDDDFIRGLIMFPFTIFAYILGLLESNSCHTYTLGTLYGVSLTLPCIDVQTLIGSVLYGIIDTIFAMVVMFGIIRYLINLYDYVFSVGLKGASTAIVTTEVFK